MVEIEKVVYGLTLALYDVHLRLVVAVKVAQIQEHDSQFTRQLLPRDHQSGSGCHPSAADRPRLSGWVDLVGNQI